MSQETYEKQMEDSEIIFTAVSTSGAVNFKEAERAVAILYIMDMSFSRAGISHALKRLEKFYNKNQFNIIKPKKGRNNE